MADTPDTKEEYVESIVEVAKVFDRKSQEGDPYIRSIRRDVAFKWRREARRVANGEVGWEEATYTGDWRVEE